MSFIKSTSVQFLKYVVVGTINFFFGVATYYFFLNILHLHYLAAFTLSWVFGVLLTYTLNFLWIFKPEDNFSFRSRLFKYFIVYLSSYTVNIFLLKALTDYTHKDPFFLQFAIIPIVIVINFLGMKFWSLK